MRDQLAAVAPDVVMGRVQPYADVVRRQFAQQDMIASLTWLFGAMILGATLAASLGEKGMGFSAGVVGAAVYVPP